MMPGKPLIREATLADVPHMARIIVDAWQTAYDGLIDPAYPADMREETFTSIMTGNIQSRMETIFVCEENGMVQGFISGKLQDGDYHCQVVGLYIHPRHQGKGMGSLLVDRMKSHFRERKCSRMVVWTLKGARNNSFYRKHGGFPEEYPEITVGDSVYPGVGFVFNL